MLNRITVVLICIVSLSLGGCAAKINAPKLSNGSPVTLHFYCDKGITEDTPSKNAEQIEEVSDFMERHFLGYASKSGYSATLIEDKASFKPEVGHYLVAVKIKKYDAGSKALRMTIGFGAGAVSMDTHYELYADLEAPILSKDDGVGSSNPNWVVVPAKLNEKMLVEVTKAIKKRT